MQHPRVIAFNLILLSDHQDLYGAIILLFVAAYFAYKESQFQPLNKLSDARFRKSGAQLIFFKDMSRLCIEGSSYI